MVKEAGLNSSLLCLLGGLKAGDSPFCSATKQNQKGKKVAKKAS